MTRRSARTTSSRASSSSSPKEGEKTAEDLKKLAEGRRHQERPADDRTGDPAEVPDYEIAKDADVTVLMWNGHKVKVNHAFKGELTEEDIRAIVADIPKVLGE